jgi:hypothetical protein
MLSEEQNPDSELLELVNKARVILEMPPLARLPKGIPDTSRKCVLGRSLGVEVLLDDQDRAYALVFAYRLAHRLARAWGVGRPYGMWNGWAVLLPSELNRFVHEFDALCYPHLTSAASEAHGGVRSELRDLRFDWMAEHSRVANLIERAREACGEAQAVVKQSRSSSAGPASSPSPKPVG